MKPPNATRLILAAVAIFAVTAAIAPLASASPHHRRHSIPDFANRRAQVVAHDRSNAVALANLIKDSTLDTEDSVPTLNKVPLLSRLFKKQGANKEKRKLLFLLRPQPVKNIE